MEPDRPRLWWGLHRWGRCFDLERHALDLERHGFNRGEQLKRKHRPLELLECLRKAKTALIDLAPGPLDVFFECGVKGLALFEDVEDVFF